MALKSLSPPGGDAIKIGWETNISGQSCERGVMKWNSPILPTVLLPQMFDFTMLAWCQMFCYPYVVLKIQILCILLSRDFVM